MRSPADVRAEIDDVSERRRVAWQRGRSAGAYSDRLEALYSELREAEAHSRAGDRDAIVKAARVERELEKLNA